MLSRDVIHFVSVRLAVMGFTIDSVVSLAIASSLRPVCREGCVDLVDFVQIRAIFHEHRFRPSVRPYPFKKRVNQQTQRPELIKTNTLLSLELWYLMPFRGYSARCTGGFRKNLEFRRFSRNSNFDGQLLDNLASARKYCTDTNFSGNQFKLNTGNETFPAHIVLEISHTPHERFSRFFSKNRQGVSLAACSSETCCDISLCCTKRL